MNTLTPGKTGNKTDNKLGLSMVCAAFVFFFLPDLSLIDFLPDVIGYILLAIGLSKLADLNDSVSAAKSFFVKMIYVGFGKIAAMFLIFGLTDANERPTAMLVVLFVAAVLECILLIPAYRQLSEGILYLGTRNAGKAVFETKRRHSKNQTESVFRLTQIFIIVKNICVVFPEFLSLSVDDQAQSYNYTSLNNIGYYRFIGILISLVFGIIWLKRIIGYFRSLMADRVFMSNISEKYMTDIAPNRSLFFRRRIKLAFLLLGIGAAFAVDFYINGNDGFSILPDVVTALCFIAGALIMKSRENKWWKYSVIVSSVYGVITSLAWYFNYSYSYKYTPYATRTDVTANALWKVLCGVAVIEAAAFIAAVVLICLTLTEVIRKDTGYIPTHPTIDPEARAKELHQKLVFYLRICIVTSVFAAAGGVFRIVMFSSASMLADISWIIEAAVSAVFASVFIYSLYRINDEIKEKYMLS